MQSTAHRLRSRSAVVGLACLTLAGCLDPGQAGNLVPKTVEHDPSLPSIEIDGALFHSETFGRAGDPMVMVLHGGPGSDYRALLPLQDLADDGFYVVFWDQRGAGLSQRFPASSYSFDTYIDDLRKVVDYYTTSAEPFVIIGHSWGAMYATWFINEYSDDNGRLQGAILSEPGGFTDKQLSDYIDRLFGSLNYFGEQVNDAAWLAQIVSPFDHARADYASSLIAYGGTPAENLDEDNPTPSWRFGAVVHDRLFQLVEDEGFDWTTNLAAYDRKVLFLRGDLNEANPLSYQQELASAYPDAEIVTIPNVGHEMIWERPEEYLAATRAYFQEIGFSGATP
jgi:proline iminopeptidase